MRSAKIATAAAEINYLLNEIKTTFMLKEKYLAEARTKLLEMQNMVFDTNLIIAQHDPKLIDIFSSYVLKEVDESLKNGSMKNRVGNQI